MADKPKILFIPGTPHASRYYRMLLPAIQLQRDGYEVDSAFFNTVDPFSLMATNGNGLVVDLKKADIIVFQMVWHQALVQVIKKVKALNIKTYMDIDDNYYALPAQNPAFNSFHPHTQLLKDKEDKLVFMRQRQQFKETFTRHGKKFVRDRKFEPTTNFALDNLEQAMQLVNVLQVSTPELKEVYSKFNSNIVVLPNCVDMQNYDITKPKRSKNELITVGWYGTKTHADDLQILDGLIPDNCKLVLIGVEDLVEKENLFHGVKNLELRPIFGDIDNLPDAIKDIDIGVCPLVDNQFNRGKSELKAIEFNAMGIPVICSDVAPYSRYICHGVNGMLVSKNKTKFWIRYLKYLISNKTSREEMSDFALKFARGKDIKNNIALWKEAYVK